MLCGDDDKADEADDDDGGDDDDDHHHHHHHHHLFITMIIIIRIMASQQQLAITSQLSFSPASSCSALGGAATATTAITNTNQACTCTRRLTCLMSRGQRMRTQHVVYRFKAQASTSLAEVWISTKRFNARVCGAVSSELVCRSAAGERMRLPLQCVSNHLNLQLPVASCRSTKNHTSMCIQCCFFILQAHFQSCLACSDIGPGGCVLRWKMEARRASSKAGGALAPQH